MNHRRLIYLGRLIDMFTANPGCMTIERFTQIQNEYNNLLMQSEAESSHFGERKGERRDALVMERRVNVEFKTKYK